MTKEEKIADVMELVDAYAYARVDYREDIESASLTAYEVLALRKTLREDREFIESKLRELIKDDE